MALNLKDDDDMQAQPPPPPPHEPYANQPIAPASSGTSAGVWIAVAVAVAVIVVLGAGAFFFLGTEDGSTPGDDDWVAFTDPATGVSVELPGEPETTEENIPVPGTDGVTIYLHIVEERDAAWSLGVYTLPADDVFDLDLAIAGGIEGMSGTLVESSPVTVSGFPGIDAEATFSEDGHDGISFMRILMLEGEQTAVLLQSLGLESDREMVEETFDRLAASFTP